MPAAAAAQGARRADEVFVMSTLSRGSDRLRRVSSLGGSAFCGGNFCLLGCTLWVGQSTRSSGWPVTASERLADDSERAAAGARVETGRL